MIVTIQEFTVPLLVNQVSIEMPEFRLGVQEGYANVTLGSETYPQVQSHRILIPQEVYTKWGTDDLVIVRYVLGQLNLPVDLASDAFSIKVD